MQTSFYSEAEMSSLLAWLECFASVLFIDLLIAYVTLPDIVVNTPLIVISDY